MTDLRTIVDEYRESMDTHMSVPKQGFLILKKLVTQGPTKLVETPAPDSPFMASALAILCKDGLIEMKEKTSFVYSVTQAGKDTYEGLAKAGYEP